MGVTTALRQELKREFVPRATKAGFILDQRSVPTFVRFRRERNGEVHLFDIQWEKYGSPRFVVNFGTCPDSGVLINGKLFPPDKVAASWAPMHGRLQPSKGALTTNWFRQDKPLLRKLFSREKMYPPSYVVAQLIELFEELEEFWRSGAVGPHMRLFKNG